MKISKKLVSFMLALAMVVTAMAVQTVPVQAKTKAIKVTNIKGNKLTLYKNETLNIKTNYKNDKVQVVTNDRSVVKVDGMNWIYAGKPGKTKIIVWLKSNHKNQKVINVTVSNKYTATRTEGGGNSVRELYNSKTKKSTYEVTVKGKDSYFNTNMNIKLKFTLKAKGLTGTGYAGELTSKKCGVRLYNISNSKDYEALKNFETMSNKEIYTYYEVPKKDVKQTKVLHTETDAGYVLIISTPNGKENFTDCVIKDKKTGSLYELEYTGTENPYTVYKSVQVM